MRFFPCQSCSLPVFLAAWKVSLRSSRVYFWLRHSSMQSCCQEVDFCRGRPQVKKRHPSTSSWNLLSNASLAPGSWPSNPCLGHFCLRLPLILCNSSLTSPHIIPLWISTTFFFPDKQFWEETFQIFFFQQEDPKKHVNINEANLITVQKVRLDTVCGCSYPAVSCTDTGNSCVFTEGEKYLAASDAFSRLLGVLAKSVLYSCPIFCGP